MPLPILIAGAGPTGLNLALSLGRRGAPFRIISDAEGPGEHSRAMVVQARTLEFYGQFGFADQAVANGVIAGAVHIREGGDGSEPREISRISFRDLGGDISPYPFALAFPQDDHERFLIARLKEIGCEIEWRSKLIDFVEDDAGIRTRVRQGDKTEEIQASYICGCDGAHSSVRQTLKIGFPGGTYDQLFYVADVRISRGADQDLYINLGEHILTIMFPVRSTGMQRLIGLVPPELSERKDLTFEDVRQKVERQIGITVVDVNWFSTYRVHHRVAEHFRAGRAFLAGDASHIHSPVGGQGMNTGIGDAINLGWKLAHVVQNRADASLLDTYEPERIGFARSLVATTDRAFTPLTSDGISGELTRRIFAPLLFSVALRFTVTRHALFRTVSQARIHYPDSPLSEGKAGHVHGGDRLPWLGPHAEDNFAPLRSLDWQLHLYGSKDEGIESACRESGLPVHFFAWNDYARHAGFERDAAYLIRPDGYVALALPDWNISALEDLRSRFGIRFTP